MKNLPIYISLLLLLTCAKEDSQDPGTTPSNILPKYTLTASAGDGGSVSTLGGSYNKGTQVSITATPSEGYRFTGWSNGSSDNPVTVTLNSNTSITANFEQIPVYSISVSAEEGGSVSSEGGDYSEGEQVTITTTPDEGYEFSGWSDGNTEATRVITASEDVTLTATFTELEYSYQLTVSAGEGGSVSSEGGEYNEGTEVTITATPDEGYVFIRWKLNQSDEQTQNYLTQEEATNLQLTVILEEDTIIEAEFDIQYNIDINFTNGESVVRELRPLSVARWRVGQNKYFIAIEESEGYQIDRWEMQSAGGFLEINEIDKVALFGSDQRDIVINIYLKPSEHELKINKDGNGQVIVDLTPNDNNKYEYRSELNISVVPDEGWIFVGFNIDEKNAENIPNNFNFNGRHSKKIILNGDYEVTAIFQKVNWAKSLIDQGYFIEYNDSIKSKVVERSYAAGNASFSYSYGSDTYLLLAGYGLYDSDTKVHGEKGNPILLKKVNNKLEQIKIFEEVSFENPRNYSIFYENDEMFVVIGDAAENAPSTVQTGFDLVIARDGDGYVGKIFGDDIQWKKINNESSKHFWHGHAVGDINFDGLYDVISGRVVFTQNQDGNFTRTNYDSFNQQTNSIQEGIIGEFISRDYGGSNGIADLNNDGINEIIEPSGSGPEYPESKYNNGIIIYEFSEVTGYYEPVFRSEDAFSLYTGINGGVYLEALDLNNDGLKDLAISKEGLINNSEYGKIIEIWINKGDFQFERKDFFATSPAVPYVSGNLESGANYEFRTFDVNKDGFMDIVFNGSRSPGFVSRDQSTDKWSQWTLNPLIWLNDGTGNFNMYNDKDLTVYAYPIGSNLTPPQTAIPYMNQQGDLSFFIYIPTPNLPGENSPPFVRYIDLTPDL